MLSCNVVQGKAGNKGDFFEHKVRVFYDTSLAQSAAHLGIVAPAEHRLAAFSVNRSYILFNINDIGTADTPPSVV